jgi:hypothetical protein
MKRSPAFRHRAKPAAVFCALLLASGCALAGDPVRPPDPADPAVPPRTSDPRRPDPSAPEPYSLPELIPLPEIPAPPGADGANPAPQVSVRQRDRDTVEEARVNGILVWIKVTPRYGRPYFLIPTGGGNTYIRRDSLDTALKVPMWTLFSW